MWNRTLLRLALLLVLVPVDPAGAADEEGCLFCHRLGMVRSMPGAALDLRVRDPAGGVHDALHCSDCHPDGRKAPHPAVPGPARCIGECHGGTSSAAASHRRASFGGLTESHRAVSVPDAPCLLCHRAADRRAEAGRIVARCARCHESERDSLARGVHARLPEAETCTGCHPAHPDAAEAGRPFSCGADGCHREPTDRKVRLAGHGTAGPAAGGAGTLRVLVFLALAAAGWGSGRLLSPRGGRKGDAG